MDRSFYLKRIIFLSIVFLGVLSGVLLGLPLKAHAGLMTHPGEESFPESRFGALSQEPEYEDDAYVPVADRRPAGLEFSDANKSEKKHWVEQPVIATPGVPRSRANQNPKPDTSIRTGVQEVAIIAGDQGFFPQTVFVTRDIPVRMFITGASKKPLCLMMDFFQIRKQVRAQEIEEVSFTPNAPGQYRFYCPINGMEGTILVKDYTSIVNANTSTAVPETQERAPASTSTSTQILVPVRNSGS